MITYLNNIHNQKQNQSNKLLRLHFISIYMYILIIYQLINTQNQFMSFGTNKSNSITQSSHQNQFPTNHSNFSNQNYFNTTSTISTFNPQPHNPISSFNDMKRSNTFTSYPERASYKQLKIGEVIDNSSNLNNNAKSLQNFKSIETLKQIQRLKNSTSTNFSKDFKFQLDNFPNSKTKKNMDDNPNNKTNMYTSQIITTSNNKNIKFGLETLGRTVEQNQQKNLQSLFNKNKDQTITKNNPQSNIQFNRFPTFNTIQKPNQKDNKNPEYRRYKSYTGNNSEKPVFNNYQKPSLTPSYLKQDFKSSEQLKNQKLNDEIFNIKSEYKPNKISDFKNSQYKLPQFKSFEIQKANPFKKDKSQYQVNSSTFTSFESNLTPPSLPNSLEKKQYYNQLVKKTNERIIQSKKNDNFPSLKKSLIFSSNFNTIKNDQNQIQSSIPSAITYNNFSKFPKKFNINPVNTIESNEVKKSMNFPPQQNKKISKDDFVMGKKLGKGKFGDVFLVKHKSVGFVCALKIIPKKLIKEEKLQNQFSRQVTVQFYLQHKNITALYGYFDDNDNVYLLLQLCLDGQLFTVLKEKRRLPQQQASDILKQICIGTEYMHRERIIHRDIKPENIIMQNGIAKICDFGWAVYRADGLRQTFCGTPLYVSPQILKGQKYDQKIDIWAIGILCYQLLIGRIPFKINSENDLKRIINDQITFPQYIPISDTAKDFIMKILKKNPDDRMDLQQLLTHDFLKIEKAPIQTIQADCIN